VAHCGDVYENTVTGERGVAPRGNEDDDGQPALVHLIVQPHGQLPASMFTRGSGWDPGHLRSARNARGRGRADPYRRRGGSGRAGHMARLLESR